MFKKIIILLIVSFFGSLSITFLSYAECDVSQWAASEFLKNCADGTNGIAVTDTQDIAGVKERVKGMAEKAIAFGALLAVGALVWAGIQYTSSFGEDEKIKHAKSTGVYAVIGLILLMASFGLVDIVINFIYTLEK